VTDWPSGVGLRRYDSIDSTNEEARRQVATGERGPLWIVAREQTKGRGRRGRVWVSKSGNLFATLILSVPPAASAQLGFAAALAVADTIASYAPGMPVALKWPNDILLDGKKVGGILLETADHDTLAIGIGINLDHCPEGTEFPATSLKLVTGSAPGVEVALAILAGRWCAWYEVWRSKGFGGLRKSWLARAAGQGREIRARLHEGEMHGVFEGLDEDGALLLRRPEGALMRITAADVFFPV
jgi:BirA family biotin operon repressor/biotin-[acetyl-CoA-carboxylase] ligase